MAKPPKRPRIAVAKSQIENELEVQLRLLRSSCDRYDAGDQDEYRRIALAIRILVYDQGQSRSLLSQLGMKHIPFFAFSRPVDRRNLMSEWPLAHLTTSTDPAASGWGPHLQTPIDPVRSLFFEDWWTEPAFMSHDREEMDRAGFVLHVANQAGGAHVDPELDAQFYRIVYENAAGWVAFGPEGQRDMAGLERAYLRHIGFEVLTSIEAAWAIELGNRGCACGSGRKHRYCCGKKV